MKRYDQYCPIAHALGLVGERWALLIVRELLYGPKRYTDLATQLPGIGTNILASRLKDLEAGGIVVKRRLPPPAASQVYELTPYGQSLKSVVRELALWGLRSLGPPVPGNEPAEGWLVLALDTLFAPVTPHGTIEFRIDDELAHVADGASHAGPAAAPDAVLQAGIGCFYNLVVDGSWEGVEVTGDRDLVERVLAAATGSPTAGEPTPA